MEMTTTALSKHVTHTHHKHAGEHTHVDRAAPSVHSQHVRLQHLGSTVVRLQHPGLCRFSRANRRRRDIYRARGTAAQSPLTPALKC